MLVKLKLSLLVLLLERLLVSDVFAYRGLFVTDSTHAVPSRPERTAKQSSLCLHNLAMYPNGAFTLEITYSHRDTVLRWNAQQHMDMIWPGICLEQLYSFSHAQFAEDTTDLRSTSSVDYFVTALRQVTTL